MPILHNWDCELRNRSRKIEQTAHINGYRPLVVFPCDGRYSGEWKNSKLHGFGAKHQSNSLVYDGQWVDGKRQGKGTVRKVLPNGTANRIYIGEWKNNKKHGEGKKYYKNGIYYGWWKNDKRWGLGIMWYFNGIIYLGEWANDKYDGAGVLYQANENRYEGLFRDGIKNGEGIFYHNKTGQVQKGIWVDGICKTSIMLDEFRNQVTAPTAYPIPEIDLEGPDKIVHDIFREYMPKLLEKSDSLEGLACLDLVKKIKQRFQDLRD